MKKLLASKILLILCLSSTAQNTATIKGKLVDSTTKQSMLNASVTLLQAKDSSLEMYSLARAGGDFDIKNIPFGNYILQISYQGFYTISKNIELNKDNALLQLPTIYMQVNAKDLGNVTVTSTPITMKKDTVEYNANSFKTKPNAVVEDLLKKMPGVQVEKDGTIKAQGEQVQRVLVDGKRFFGDDPKMATKNLPTDVVDKIQIFDGLSDQSNFSGFDDGNRVKTINIITKKDKRKGYFGKGSIGFGNDGNNLLNDHSLSLSKYNGNQQITVTAQGNNVNKQNFNVQDILGSLGGGGGNMRGFGGGSPMGGGRGGGAMGGIASAITNLIGNGNANGIVNTWSGGLNYRDVWSKKTEAYGSYFFNSQQTNRIQNTLTQNFVSQNPDSSIFNNQNNNSLTTNRNHRVNFNIEHNFDSSNSLIIRPNISIQNTNNDVVTTTASTKLKTINLNNTNANSIRNNNGINGSIDATFRHRFKKRGRTISLGLNLGRNTNDGSGNNYSVIQTFPSPTIVRSDTINQQYTSYNNSNSFSTNISYTEPIAKNQQVEIAYNHSFNLNENDKKTLAFDNTAQLFIIPVTNQTNNFNNDFNANRVSISYRFNNQKLNFSVGSGVQFASLYSNNNTTGIRIPQHFTNLFPQANLNYSFTKTKNLRFNYSGRTNQPSAQQLQPVIDFSDPLNIKEGNPFLKQSFNHSVRLFYNSFNVFTQKIFFATINASFTSNDIQNSSLIAQNGVQTTKPVNLNGTYSIVGYINYGFPLRKPKSNLNFGMNVNAIQSQTLINNQSNFTRNTGVGGNIIWTTNLKEKWDINLTSNSMYNLVSYTLQPNQNENFFSQFVSVEATYYTKSGWSISSDFDYTYNAGRASGFNTSIPLFNASIAKQVFKNKAGEIKLYVFDLFKQNQSITRNVTASYVQDVNTTVLQQYFLVSFTYNLRNFGGKNNQMPGFFRGNGGGGGGQRRGGGF